jgi:hypothetical protein
MAAPFYSWSRSDQCPLQRRAGQCGCGCGCGAPAAAGAVPRGVVALLAMASEDHHHRVVVVGGGLAGLAAARLLHDHYSAPDAHSPAAVLLLDSGSLAHSLTLPHPPFPLIAFHSFLSISSPFLPILSPARQPPRAMSCIVCNWSPHFLFLVLPPHNGMELVSIVALFYGIH